MTKGKSKKVTLRVKSRQQEDDHEDVIEDMDFLTSEERAQLIYEEDQNESCDDDDDDHRHSDQETETRRLILQQNRKKKKSGGFQSMGLSLPVFKGIMKKGYRVPTPIQRKTIPLIMDGKDLVAMARTGSGKTAAFLVPLFERLKTHSAKIGARALILSPTRELALQTMKFTKELGHFTDLRAIVILGGDRIDDQFSALHENPDIIIATPGRFLHLLVEMEMKLTTIEYIVFDEADRLFEMGFSEQLYEIIKRLPEQRQTLLFSATLPKLLVEFAKAGLSDPVLIRLDVDSKLSEQLSQSYLSCRDDDKPAVLIYLLHSIISSTNEQTIVFVPTKYHVEYLRELLLAAGIETSYVYSSLDPTARKINVSKFVHKKTNILLVTDIAARGIDIPLLDNVVNYNFPSKPKLFVHRVGRVARAGRSGTSYSLVSSDEVPYMLDLHLFLGKSVSLSGKEGVYGSVPQVVIDGEDELLRQLFSINHDLGSLKQVADNGMKQYLKSRNPPAPESVKRAKGLPTLLPSHPIFDGVSAATEQERSKLLDGLKCYKPSQTIFEVNPTAKGVANEIMKLKRKKYNKIVSATREKQHQQLVTSEKTNQEERGVSQELSTADDWKDFKTLTSSNQTAKRKDQPYIHYTPSDHHTEKGLSLDTSGHFERQASHVTMDLTGDEGIEIIRSKGSKKWDRKRKRFVNETGRENTKKIKTESGRWIPATYKSGLYKDWKSKNKIEGILTGEEQDSTITPSSLRLGRKRGRFNTQPSPFSSFGGQRGKHGDGELKSVKEILQKREKVQFMKERRLKKRRQKGRSGGSGRSLGGRGKKGSGIQKTGGKGRTKRKTR